MLRIGILGAGQMGSIHAGALVATGQVQISVVFDTSEQSARALASTYHAKVATTPIEVFSQKLDAVVIAVPTCYHAEYLELAYQAHVHVLCEKPLVRDETQLRRITSLFKSTDRVIMVGHTLRFFPAYEHAYHVLRRKELGHLGVLRLTRCGGFCLPETAWQYSFDQSGGVTLDMMIHDLDFVEWAAGRFVEVFARRSSSDSLRDEFCVAIGKLENGALVHLEASWAEPLGSFYYAYEIAAERGILDYDSRQSPSYCFVRRVSKPKKDSRKGCQSFTPDKGFSINEEQTPTGWGHDLQECLTPTVQSPYDRQAEAFVEAALGKRPVPVSLTDGARAVQLGLAVLRSAESGGVVRVSD